MNEYTLKVDLNVHIVRRTVSISSAEKYRIGFRNSKPKGRELYLTRFMRHCVAHNASRRHNIAR